MGIGDIYGASVTTQGRRRDHHIAFGVTPHTRQRVIDKVHLDGHFMGYSAIKLSLGPDFVPTQAVVVTSQRTRVPSNAFGYCCLAIAIIFSPNCRAFSV